MTTILRFRTLHIVLFLWMSWSVSVPAEEKLEIQSDLHGCIITFEKSAHTLEQIFHTIEQQSDWKFCFESSELPLKTVVVLPLQHDNLYHVLCEAGKQLGLAFTRIDHQLIVKADSAQMHQTYSVRGTIYNATTKEPLPYASIINLVTAEGMAADENGKFLFHLAPGAYQFRCSYVGFKATVLDIDVHKDTSIVIEMNSLDMMLQDVTVYATQEEKLTQQEINILTMQSETMKKSTGLMSDVLRSVQLLPGVSNDNELSAKFNVHGGDENENLVLINGSEVYEPYHIKEASNVSIGIFNTDLIKKMDLITGGFSARYGDRLSSVLDIDYREGDRDRMKGQASLSLTDADGLIEGPLGSNGSFIIGFRQSYLQYEVNMVDPGALIHPSYYDVQGVFSYQMTPKDKLLLKVIQAGDNYYENPDIQSSSSFTNSYITNTNLSGSLSQAWHDSSEEHAHYYTTMIALQNVAILSSSSMLKTELSCYDEIEVEHSTELDLYNNLFHSVLRTGPIDAFYKSNTNYYYDNNLHIQTWEMNASYDWQLNSGYNIKAGASFQHIYYYQQLQDQQTFAYSTNDYRYPLVDDSLWYINLNNGTAGFDHIDAQANKEYAYLENIFQISESIVLNAGARVDYFGLNKDLTWSPRISLAFAPSPDLTLRGAWGVYYQSPIYQQLQSSISSDTNTKSQQAIHYVVGADGNIYSDEIHQTQLKYKLTVYDKQYDNLISSFVSSSGRVYYSRKNDAIGYAAGFDCYLMYALPGMFGWFSYSYLQSEQKFTAPDTIGYYFPRNTDQRHTLAILTEIDLGKEWNITTRMTYGSGYPYTPSVAEYDQKGNVWNWKRGSLNSAYLPAYRRVDVRASKEFSLFGFPASAFIDISNLLNFNNIQSYSYEYDSQGNPKIVEHNLWPLLPTFGITVKF
ncbi:MAG TPA: TonB-dependent receptor [Bacteroidota bacterium]|nr:TonB-dependent receptor [Bacteroidota bacterium]